MARAARDFRVWWGRHLLPARSDFGPGTARRPPDRQEMQRHRARALCDHRRHVGSAAGDLALRPPCPCPWVRPQPPTRHSQARLAVRFALPSPQHSPTPHPSFSCDGHSPCCRRRRRRSSAGSSSSPPASKRMCGPGASAIALIWRPGKGTEDAHFLGRNPGAICGHRDQELFPQTAHCGRVASSDLLSQLDIGPSYEPFHGFTPCICTILPLN